MSFRDQARVWDTAPHKVIVAYPALAVVRIGSRASAGDDDRRNPTLEEIVSMIEPRTIYRGRTSGVFRRPENHNRIRRVEFLLRRGMHDAYTGE